MTEVLFDRQAPAARPGLLPASSPAVDATETDSIAALFDAVGTVDAVVAALGTAPFEPLAELDHDDFVSGLPGQTVAQIGSRASTPVVAVRAGRDGW